MGFSVGLCSVLPSQKPFMLSVKFGSLLLPFSSEPCLMLKAVPSHICLACPLLPLWVTCHRHQVTTREPASPQSNSAFQQQLFQKMFQKIRKCFREGLSPRAGAAAQAHSGLHSLVVLLLYTELLHLVSPSVFLLTAHFQ